jgi:hypothetical protein
MNAPLSDNERRKARYLILKGLYDRGAWTAAQSFEPWDVGETVALSAEESEHAAAELERAGLVEWTQDGLAVCLSDEGLRTIERVLRQPLPANDAYPEVMDFDDVFRGTRSADEVDDFLGDLRRVLPKLKLEEGVRAELILRMDAVEIQLGQPSPSRQFTLSGLARIRDLLSTAAEGDGIAIVAHVTRLLDETGS